MQKGGTEKLMQPTNKRVINITFLSFRMKPQETRLKIDSMEFPKRIRLDSGLAKYIALFEYDTKRKVEICRITDEIEKIIEESGISYGTVLVQSLHTTSAVCVGEFEEYLCKDMINYINEHIPKSSNYQHNKTEESGCKNQNADSHLAVAYHGQTSIVLPFWEKKIILGRFQDILIREHDGPHPRMGDERNRQCIVYVEGIEGNKSC